MFGRSLAAMALCLVAGCRAPPPEALFPTEPFQLVDARGRPFGSANLSGKVWVADFFFTTCPGVCEELTKTMVALADRLEVEAPEVELVSFTVDPETDDPAALLAYAQKFGAERPNWHFLTGEPDELRAVVVGNFKQPMEVEAQDEDQAMMRIAHGVRFVLMDGEGRVRGLYDAKPEALDPLIQAARAL
ncbi:MAG: SCO family protein [Myxococcota bacterium]